jgi:hypothetical protein
VGRVFPWVPRKEESTRADKQVRRRLITIPTVLEDLRSEMADAADNFVDQEDGANDAAAHQGVLRQQAHVAAAAALNRMNHQDNNRRWQLEVVRRFPGDDGDGGGGHGILLGEPEHIARRGDMDDLSFRESYNNNNGWSEVETNGGTAPAPRSLHTAAILNGVMYVFGGYDGNTRVNSFHAYSFAEKRWSPVLPSTSVGGTPSPRDRHIAFAFGNSVYIHGGFDGISRVSDFWGFDLSSMTWREVEVLGGRPPSPRHSHSSIVWRDCFYCWGGYDGSYSKYWINEIYFQSIANLLSETFSSGYLF